MVWPATLSSFNAAGAAREKGRRRIGRTVVMENFIVGVLVLVGRAETGVPREYMDVLFLRSGNYALISG